MGNLAAAHFAVLERIAQARPLSEVLGSIVDMVEAEADDVLCSILLYDARDGTLHHGAASRLPQPYVDAIDGVKAGPHEGSCGAAAYLGTPVVVADIATHPNWTNYRAFALPHGLRSCWSTPIKASDGEVLGTFAMYHTAPGLPSDGDFVAVEMATHAAAIAIMRTRFDDSLRQSESRSRQLARLYAVSSAINEAIARVREPDQLYRIACQIAVEKGLARLAWICTGEAESRQLRTVARYGHDEGYVDAVVTLLGSDRLKDGFFTQALFAGQVSVINDIEAAEEFAFKELALAHGLASLAVFPLEVEGSTRGVLAIGAESKGFFLAEELEVLTALAADLSFAVQSALGQKRREQAEAQLAEQQALLAIAGRAARLGGIRINLDPWRVALTAETCAMFGLEPGTSLSREEAFSFVHQEHQKPVMQAVWSAARAGRPFDVEFEAVTKSGRSLWVRVVGDAIEDEAGQLVRIQAALQDVTERRKLEQQLRQAQKMDAVGTLAGGVAHDFNNILSVILSYCQLASLPLDATSPARADLQEIEVAARRASELTRQLLAFSRHGMMMPRVLDVNEVVLGMKKMLGRLVGADVEVSVSSGPDLGKVFADRGHLEQVLMNLVLNARDAMPRGGKVIIETMNVDLDAGYTEQYVDVPAGPYVQLAVSDSGVGMDAATRERIFEPFFTTKEQGKGTGLGLSTVWGIVKQSGGHIGVYSEVGVGTTFRLYLPRVDRAVEREVERPRISLQPSGNETILLVEDDPQLRAIAARVLKEQGYVILQATNGVDALAVAQAHTGPIHLLLTDVVMPKLSGFELAEQLRAQRADLKVLFVSGYTHEAIKRRDTGRGEFEFLPKPLTPDVLLQRVRDVLDTELADA